MSRRPYLRTRSDAVGWFCLYVFSAGLGVFNAIQRWPHLGTKTRIADVVVIALAAMGAVAVAVVWSRRSSTRAASE